MTDPVANRIAQQAAEQAASTGAAPVQDIQPEDQQKFDQAMEATEPTEVQEVDAAESVEVNATDNKSMGDAMLEGLQNLKSSYDKTVNKIETTLIDTDSQELTVQELMKVQMELMQVGLQQDLTTKVADKTSQGIQTLFRNQ